MDGRREKRGALRPGLVELLVQDLQVTGRTAVLRVLTLAGDGEMVFHQGELEGCRFGNLSGEEAYAALCGLASGGYELAEGGAEPEPPVPFPEAERDLPGTAPAVVGSLAPVPRVGPGGERVLVVDDDREVRDLLAATLGSAGHDVIVAADGLEALERTRADQPELIVSDMMMPRMDGWQLLSQVRSDARLRDTLFVFFSWHDDFTAELRRYGVRADRFLDKGLTAAQIQEAVAELLAPRRGLRLRLHGAAPDDCFEGSFSEVPARRVISFIAELAVTATMFVEGLWHDARLHFDQGRLVAVRDDGAVPAEGEAALDVLVALRSGSYRIDVQRRCVAPPNLRGETLALLDASAERINAAEESLMNYLLATATPLRYDPRLLDMYTRESQAEIGPIATLLRQGLNARDLIARCPLPPERTRRILKDLAHSGVVDWSNLTEDP